MLMRFCVEPFCCVHIVCSLVGGEYIYPAHIYVVVDRVRLREIVRQVCRTFFPLDCEFILAYLVAYPMVSHVNCLGTLLFYSVIRQAYSTCVVI